MFGQLFDYLRLPKYIGESITHQESYIKSGDKNQSERRIFKKVYYEKFEIEQLHNTLLILKNEGIVLNSILDTYDVIFRFLYANQFDVNMTIDVLCYTRYLIWYRELLRSLVGSVKSKNNSPVKIASKYVQVFQQGLMYFSGRDKQYRPTLVIDVSKFKLKSTDMDIIIQSLSILCLMMQEYFFYEGRVENWNIFIDTQQRCLVDIPLPVIKEIVSMMQIHFPQTLEKVYIFAPSLSLSLSWSMIEDIIPKKTRSKVVMMKTPTYVSELLKQYSPEQLEIKFGGSMKNFEIFWPPFNTISEEQYVEFVEEQKDPMDEELNKITNYFNVDDQLNEIAGEIEQDERRQSGVKYEKVNDDEFKKYLKDWAQQEKYDTQLPYRKLKQTQSHSIKQHQTTIKEAKTLQNSKSVIGEIAQRQDSMVDQQLSVKEKLQQPIDEKSRDDYNLCQLF